MIDLENLKTKIKNCNSCSLCNNSPVYGIGSINPLVMLIGEAPGEEEEIRGVPFVGPSGQLLQNLLANQNLKPGQFYVTNVLKHRPPNNRTPTETEISSCIQFLQEEIGYVKPRNILCLGTTAQTALSILANRPKSNRSLRGQSYMYGKIVVVNTWHPAYILRNPTKQTELINDIITALEIF